MSPLPILLAAGAVAALAVAAKRAKAGVNLAPIDVTNIPGADPPISAPSATRGKSGTMWLIEEVRAGLRVFTEPNEAHFDVILNDPNIPARPHMVVRFAIIRTNPTVRRLVKTGPSTPQLIAAAKSDFNILG